MNFNLSQQSWRMTVLLRPLQEGDVENLLEFSINDQKLGSIL
jgi:hypothetical protein